MSTPGLPIHASGVNGTPARASSKPARKPRSRRMASTVVGRVGIWDRRKLKNEGLGASKIAKQLKIGRASVYRVLNERDGASAA